MSSSATPAALLCVPHELLQMLGDLHAHVDWTASSCALWGSEAAANGDLVGFFRRYVRVLSRISPKVDLVSTDTGVPVVALKAEQAYIGVVRVFRLCVGFGCVSCKFMLVRLL
jgi:hypothetical protein